MFVTKLFRVAKVVLLQKDPNISDLDGQRPAQSGDHPAHKANLVINKRMSE